MPALIFIAIIAALICDAFWVHPLVGWCVTGVLTVAVFVVICDALAKHAYFERSDRENEES